MGATPCKLLNTMGTKDTTRSLVLEPNIMSLSFEIVEDEKTHKRHVKMNVDSAKHPICGKILKVKPVFIKNKKPTLLVTLQTANNHRVEFQAPTSKFHGMLEAMQSVKSTERIRMSKSILDNSKSSNDLKTATLLSPMCEKIAQRKISA